LLNPPAAAPARETAQAANLANRKAWNTHIIVRTITRNQFAAAINDVYYDALDNPTEGLNASSLQDLVTHIQTTYASISQPNINDNMTEFYTGIEASLPLAVYTRKQKKMSDVCPGCWCSHLRSHDGYYWNEGRPQLRRHGTFVA
jgi:hypothetical protein